MSEHNVKTEELFSGLEGQGFDNLETQDFAPPFLAIIQSNSPEMQPDSEKYNPHARVGMIVNKQTGNVFDRVHVQVAKYDFRAVEWKPRNSGGGFVASYRRTEVPDDLTVDPINGATVRKSNLNVVNQTGYYLLLLQEEGWSKVILPMTSTQLKKSRSWNSLMQAKKFGEAMDKTLPMFGCIYELTTVIESNAKGKWYGWRIDNGTMILDKTLIANGHEASKATEFLPDRVIKAISNQSSDEEVI